MNLVELNAPSAEPVSLAEVKAQLRLNDSLEDGYLAGLISAARQVCEDFTGRALIARGFRLVLDDWPGRIIALPKPPLQHVSAIRLFGADGDAEPVDSALYFADFASAPGRVLLRAGNAWPAVRRERAGVEIDFHAGFGASWNDVPRPLRLGIMQLVSHWFENRMQAGPIPAGVRALWQPWRLVKL